MVTRLRIDLSSMKPSQELLFDVLHKGSCRTRGTMVVVGVAL